MSSKIQTIQAREILDSRGTPTIETDIMLESGQIASASVPSGASVGSSEAVELRDQDSARYNGKGVLQAVANVNTLIAPALLGREVIDQAQIDAQLCSLDGSTNKAHLGANALLSVSLAAAKAAAQFKKQTLYQYIAELHGTAECLMPIPMFNVLNGGQHANNRLDIQEIMLRPAAGVPFPEMLRMGVETFYSLKTILNERDISTAVGDEGGFAPNFDSTEAALQLLEEAITNAGYQLGKDFTLALDCAASEFFQDEQYQLQIDDVSLSSQGFLDYLQSFIKKYAISSLEDAMSEHDHSGWQQMTAVLGHELQIVADDLFATNATLLQQGIKNKMANAILIKPNQVGTLSETLESIRIAQDAGYAVVISHRSGETEDVSIADIAVGTAAGQIKTGSLCRSDRIAKYNRLLKIYEQIACT